MRIREHVPRASLLLVLAMLPPSVFGTITSTMVWEVRTTGSDTNGGGFKAGATGTDWSQQASPQYSVADGVAAGSTTITSATANFGADVVGNIIYVQGGTGSVAAGWYEITARASTTSITVDRATGLTAGTGVTLHIGGAILSPGIVGAAAVSGNTIYIKGGTYSCSTSNNVASGRVTTLATQRWEGYNATRGDLGTPPVLQASANSVTIFTASGGTPGTLVVNLTFDGNTSGGKSFATGFSQNSAAFTVVQGCLALNCGTYGFDAEGDLLFLQGCEASGCTTGFAMGAGNRLSAVQYCTALNCTTGYITNPGTLDYCVAVGCATGFSATNLTVLRHCVAYGKANSTGFTTPSAMWCYSCLSVNNTGGGVGFSTSSGTYMDGCAYYNNGTNVANSPLSNLHAVTLTADPFTNAAGNDFSLNAVAGGGAACRAAGYPATWPGLSTTSHRDIGAAQHADPAAGGGFRPRPRTSFNLVPGQIPAAPRVLPAASEREWRKAG